MIRFLLPALLMLGCADPYGDAKKADTIEAYDTFLATNPTGADKLMAETRLEELMVKRAEESHAIADYDAVLKKFPSSRKGKEMKEGRSNAAFAVAEADGSVEAWKKFLEENDFADSALKKRAKGMVDVAEFSAVVAIGTPVVEPTNLAGDAAGPKDGWGVKADITNNGTVALEYANIELQFLDAEGKKLKAVSWPVAAQSGPGGMPIEEAYTKPLAPAETRSWAYTTGEAPEGWAEGKIKLVLVAARAVPATPAPTP